MSSAMTPAVAVAPALSEAPTSLRRDAWRRLRANKIAVIGLIIISILAFIAIFGSWLTPYDFLSQDLASRNLPPSWLHFLGTDELGRDVASRLIYGTRTAFIVALVVTGISLVIGATLGAIAGYMGGWVDGFIIWLSDTTMSVPNLLLVIVINTSMKPVVARWMEAMYQQTYSPIFRNTLLVDFVLVFGSMALISWPQYARLVRGQVLSIRSRPYVLAARSLGLTQWQIITRYIIPNATAPLIVAVSAGLGTAMVLESSFSFLGIGVSPPTPSWGVMISDGLRVWRQYPHLLAAPAVVLALATVSFSFLGDGLNDALNPKSAK